MDNKTCLELKDSNQYFKNRGWRGINSILTSYVDISISIFSYSQIWIKIKICIWAQNKTKTYSYVYVYVYDVFI